MTVKETKQFFIDRLTESVGQREAAAMVRIIVEDVGGLTPIQQALSADRQLEPETVSRIAGVVERVIEGEPLQYVLGSTVFHGIRLKVESGVLIPRPETSGLVDLIEDRVANKRDLKIIDVCSGSGAIAIALAKALPYPQITAIDISEKACQIAKENCEATGVRNVRVELRDVLKSGLPKGQYDVIVSNPPYVEENERSSINERVVKYEPEIALFVPNDNPLVFYKKIASEAIQNLSKGGSLFFEINPRHADNMKKLLEGLGYENVEILRDFAGRFRYALAKKP